MNICNSGGNLQKLTPDRRSESRCHLNKQTRRTMPRNDKSVQTYPKQTSESSKIKIFHEKRLKFTVEIPGRQSAARPTARIDIVYGTGMLGTHRLLSLATENRRKPDKADGLCVGYVKLVVLVDWY